MPGMLLFSAGCLVISWMLLMGSRRFSGTRPLPQGRYSAGSRTP